MDWINMDFGAPMLELLRIAPLEREGTLTVGIHFVPTLVFLRKCSHYHHAGTRMLDSII